MGAPLLHKSESQQSILQFSASCLQAYGKFLSQKLVGLQDFQYFEMPYICKTNYWDKWKTEMEFSAKGIVLLVYHLFWQLDVEL